MNLSSEASSRRVEAGAREFLSFTLGHEHYVIDILQVQEVRSYEAPMRIAHALPQVLGVQNLRGTIVPIVDMRVQFGLPEPRYDSLTVVIVLNVHGRLVGLVVDAVSDVLMLQAGDMREVPSLRGRDATAHLEAIATVGDRMLMLIDIERLLASPAFGLAPTVH